MSLILIISITKMLLFPFITVLIALFVFRTPDIRIPLLLSSMPTAVTTFVIAQRFNLDTKAVSMAILTSTIFSLIAVPLVLAIFAD